MFYGLAPLRFSLTLLFLVAGCGQPEPPPVEEGVTLATETYRQHFSDGVPPGLFGATVIKRGDYFVELLNAPGRAAYWVPMPSETDQRPASERARAARTGADWEIAPDSATAVRLAEIVGTFEAAGLHALASDPDGSSASFRVTPYDALNYFRSGVDPDTLRGNSTHRQLIAREWMYSRHGNSHDGT